MNDMTDEERIENMRKKSQAMMEGTASRLPMDDQLTMDAQFLRKYGITPLELLMEVAVGTRVATITQINAAKAALPFMHRAQVTKVQTEIVDNRPDPTLVATFRKGSVAELRALRDDIAASPDPETLH